MTRPIEGYGENALCTGERALLVVQSGLGRDGSYHDLEVSALATLASSCQADLTTCLVTCTILVANLGQSQDIKDVDPVSNVVRKSLK